MVSNEEIDLKAAENELKKQGVLKWEGSSYVVDFGSWHVDDLSITIKNLFENAGYHLEEGIPTDGSYGIGSAKLRLLAGYMADRYTFKVQIYIEEKNTLLKVSKGLKGIMQGIITHGGLTGYDGIISYNAEFNSLINELIYLRSLSEGYLVCDKCNKYYELQPGEFPNDFTDKCECGGNLKYTSKF